MSDAAKLHNEVFGGNLIFKYYTTAPTTGLTKGEMVMLFHGSSPKIAVCSSSGAQTLKYFVSWTTTFGRLT